MRKLATAGALVGALLPALGSPQAAGGQAACHLSGEYRQFTGQVDRASKGELILDNGKGDKLKFVPADAVVVMGEKTEYQRVEKSDWAIVSWRMADTPSIAYEICIIPDQDEGAE